MQANLNTQTLPPPTPVVAEARIEALDVVRGFALLGIFLMNIEFFNRSTSGIMEGMPAGLNGVNWWASWFIAYFVQGKFWTIFSLLFGMGFAVMLTRAERAGRIGWAFLTPYLRRIGALAVFGAAHYIFLWSGDILFSYSVGAAALLILLYGKWKPLLIGMAVLIGIGFLPDMSPAFGVAGVLSFIWFLMQFLRNERIVSVVGHRVPVFALVLLVLGAVGVVGAIVLWLLPNGPKEPRIPVSVVGVSLVIIGMLAAKFHNPVALRELRMGVTIYTFSFVMMTVFGALQYFKPREPVAPPAVIITAAAVPENAASKPEAKDAAGKPDKKPELTDAEKAEKKKVERAKRLAERQEETRHEVQVLSSGTYLQAVEMRARHFPEKMAGDVGFATVLLAMFLLGSWFVRSGVMENTSAHLPLFRKLALYGLPIGIGLGLLGSTIAVSHVAGDDYDGFQFARGLAMLGNLPACLGYVGMVVLMLHSNSVFSKIRVLAPLGRMALTNYLMQSVICSFYFFGYGLGHWGLARAWQVVFVLVVFAMQMAFSHWWLARYRFGPMEWVWRAFTYRQTPRMLL
jgi:uncharacterized membrane protein YeiB